MLPSPDLNTCRLLLFAPSPSLDGRKDVMVVDEGSDFEEVARWVRAGGRALVVGHWRDLEQCRAGLLKPLREEAANAQERHAHGPFLLAFPRVSIQGTALNFEHGKAMVHLFRSLYPLVFSSFCSSPGLNACHPAQGLLDSFDLAPFVLSPNGICRFPPISGDPKNRCPGQEAEEQRAQKKQLSDRLLGPVGLQGQIALQGAPPAEFLQSLRPSPESSGSFGHSVWTAWLSAVLRGFGTSQH